MVQFMMDNGWIVIKMEEESILIPILKPSIMGNGRIIKNRGRGFLKYQRGSIIMERLSKILRKDLANKLL